MSAELRGVDGPSTVSPTVVQAALPIGVAVRDLAMNLDDRGSFTEIFRVEWSVGVDPVQWSAVSSAAGVMRGVHVHPRHLDYLILLTGRATVGLSDLREGSPTQGLGTEVEMLGDRLQGIVIPNGVAHGFYFHEPSLHVYAVSEYWDPSDELGCHWSDEGLGIEWPVREVQLSDRDAELPELADLKRQLEPLQPFGS